jgi:hypothetical protein
MASRIFAVAPFGQQPESPGQETLYPSSFRVKATRYFILSNPAFAQAAIRHASGCRPGHDSGSIRPAPATAVAPDRPL